MKVDFEGQSCFLHFYVCDVPYCVVSVGRLLRSGFDVNLSSRNPNTLSTPDGHQVPIIRHGSLLFFPPDSCKRALGGVVKVVILLAGAGLSGIFQCKGCKSTGVRSISCMWQFQGCLAAADFLGLKALFLAMEPEEDPVELAMERDWQANLAAQEAARQKAEDRTR